MADEETETCEPVKISNGDIAITAIQVFLAWAISETMSVQYFGFASAAYAGMLTSLLCRARKRGLTATDRRIIIFSFLPIFIFAIFLSWQIGKWKYGILIFR